MMLDFSEDVDAIIKTLHLDRVLEPQDRMAIAMQMVSVFDRGISFERDRIIRLLMQHGTNPGPVIARIRKPLR